eukprot:TRINITY_DN19165_c0_g1_i1.p4 TRINITY_DN19165_c0_g1~~TRINITY_DN19165_c0_g1_i1.p4  ORF type:complete len:126 (+),score=14.39 TRINITY_DN19165_c0_g1_i1:218-595(+)
MTLPRRANYAPQGAQRTVVPAGQFSARGTAPSGSQNRRGGGGKNASRAAAPAAASTCSPLSSFAPPLSAPPPPAAQAFVADNSTSPDGSPALTETDVGGLFPFQSAHGDMLLQPRSRGQPAPTAR